MKKKQSIRFWISGILIVEEHDGGGGPGWLWWMTEAGTDTHEILTSYARENPLLVPLTKENGGHGAAILYGYRYSIEHGADYIFQTDSDGQTLPEEFGQFWQRRKAYEMVIGHRKGRQDGASRVFVTKMLRLV